MNNYKLLYDAFTIANIAILVESLYILILPLTLCSWDVTSQKISDSYETKKVISQCLGSAHPSITGMQKERKTHMHENSMKKKKTKEKVDTLFKCSERSWHSTSPSPSRKEKSLHFSVTIYMGGGGGFAVATSRHGSDKPPPGSKKIK